MKMIRLGALGLTLTLAFTSAAWAVPLYTTNFPRNENPISEGGAWYHISPLWANVQTFGGESVRHTGRQPAESGEASTMPTRR